MKVAKAQFNAESAFLTIVTFNGKITQTTLYFTV